MIRPEQILPSLLIAIDIGAAVPYALNGDWRMAVYWVAAATLTTVVTF